MAKKKEDYHKVFERIHFSKYFKRRALMEFAKLKKPNEALLACGLNLEDFDINDKKYAAKLLHKWRKELYANYEMLAFLNFEMSDEVLKREIDSIADGKEDRVMKAFAPKIKDYCRRKNISSPFLTKIIEQYLPPDD